MVAFLASLIATAVFSGIVFLVAKRRAPGTPLTMTPLRKNISMSPLVSPKFVSVWYLGVPSSSKAISTGRPSW